MAGSFDAATLIGRLSVRAAGADALAARLRLEQLLGSAELRPRGLGPSAVLCVRALRDPLPGAVSLRRAGLRPPPAWERAVADALAQAAREAARPAREVVPAAAPAVLFADRAELLACLARDYGEGAVAQRWWWREILRGREPDQAVPAAWLEAPEHVPAALEHLARAGAAVTFAGALRAEDARAILVRTLERFALPELAAEIERFTRASVAISAPPRAPRADDDRQPRLDPSAAPMAPWHRWAPEALAPALDPAQRVLLGIGLTLGRAPDVARTRAFVAEVRAHAASPSLALDVPLPAPTRARDFVVPAPSLAAPSPSAEAITPPIASSPRAAAPPPSAMLERASPASPKAIPERAPPTTIVEPSLATAILTAAPPTTILQTSLPPPPTTPEAPPAAAAPPPAWPPLLADELELPPARPLEAMISTDLGGLFYLVNLGLYLELYGDFSTPATPGIALSIWDFVTLLGQALLGDELAADPVWELLAALAGRRPEDRPGGGFEPPSEWQLPPTWLKPFRAPAVLRWSAAAGRLRVDHPEGFRLVDVPRDDGPAEAQAARETARHRMKAELDPTVAIADDGAAPLDRWLGWLVPYVRARLRAALGTASDAEAARTLCVHPARVLVTGTHVDVILGLADLPIAVRYAGLDRNAGFVPAAGRYLTFFFE